MLIMAIARPVAPQCMQSDCGTSMESTGTAFEAGRPSPEQGWAAGQSFRTRRSAGLSSEPVSGPYVKSGAVRIMAAPSPSPVVTMIWSVGVVSIVAVRIVTVVAVGVVTPDKWKVTAIIPSVMPALAMHLDDIAFRKAGADIQNLRATATQCSRMSGW